MKHASGARSSQLLVDTIFFAVRLRPGSRDFVLWALGKLAHAQADMNKLRFGDFLRGAALHYGPQSEFVGELLAMRSASRCAADIHLLLCGAILSDELYGDPRQSKRDVVEWTPKLECSRGLLLRILAYLPQDEATQRDVRRRMFALNYAQQLLTEWMHRTWPREYEEHLRRQSQTDDPTRVALDQCSPSQLTNVLLTTTHGTIKTVWETFLQVLDLMLHTRRADVVAWMMAYAHVALFASKRKRRECRGSLDDARKLVLRYGTPRVVPLC
jgi:hypothetical protein